MSSIKSGHVFSIYGHLIRTCHDDNLLMTFVGDIVFNVEARHFRYALAYALYNEIRCSLLLEIVDFRQCYGLRFKDMEDFNRVFAYCNCCLLRIKTRMDCNRLCKYWLSAEANLITVHVLAVVEAKYTQCDCDCTISKFVLQLWI